MHLMRVTNGCINNAYILCQIKDQYLIFSNLRFLNFILLLKAYIRVNAFEKKICSQY